MPTSSCIFKNNINLEIALNTYVSNTELSKLELKSYVEDCIKEIHLFSNDESAGVQNTAIDVGCYARCEGDLSYMW